MTLAARDHRPPARAETLGELLSALGAAAAAGRAELVGMAAAEPQQRSAFAADAVHFLNILHGEMPSLLDALTSGSAELGAPLAPAADRFKGDRAWLAQVGVSSGSYPGLRGLTAAETVVRNIRGAMLTLAASQRQGCALGVALGFLTDWPDLRAALDSTGNRAFGTRWPVLQGEWPEGALAALTALAVPRFQEAGARRAIGFGASQFIQVHAQLLELVGTRTAARSG